MKRAAGILVLLSLLAGGCGYSLRGNLPGHIKTVAVPIFTNRTAEPAVENMLTRAVVDALSTDGRLRVVKPEEADALLEGEVVGYEVQSVAYDNRANIRQYRLVVTLNLRLKDVRNNTVLFERAGLQEKSDFRVAGGVAQNISLEQSALRLAAVDIARAVVSLAVERF